MQRLSFQGGSEVQDKGLHKKQEAASSDDAIAEEMDEDALLELLKKSQFFQKLSSLIQEDVLGMLTQDLQKFNKFDLEKGYSVMDDNESFVEALNQLYSEQRRELYNAISHNGHEQFFNRYLRKAMGVYDLFQSS